MLNTSGPLAPRPEQLSALMDGQLEPQAVAALMAAWRDDPLVAERWHSYHLAADALRSDELASTAQRDRAFLSALRARLADEPVPLATTPLFGAAPPEPVVASEFAAVAAVAGPAGRLRRSFVAPLAVAAGFVAVAGVLVVYRAAQPLPVEGAQLASAPASASVTTVSGVKMVRDVRLDRYLNAHRNQALGFTAPGADSQQVRIVYEAQ